MVIVSQTEQHVSTGAHVETGCSLTATDSINISVHMSISPCSQRKEATKPGQTRSFSLFS